MKEEVECARHALLEETRVKLDKKIVKYAAKGNSQMNTGRSSALNVRQDTLIIKLGVTAAKYVLQAVFRI